MFRSRPVSFSVQQALAAVAVGAAFIGLSITAHARSDAPVSNAATQAKAVNGVSETSAAFQQVPGFYRQQIGNLQVTALLDGVIWLPHETVKGVEAPQLSALLAADFVPTRPEGIQTALNAFLVRRGERLMLVDAGAAQCFGPTTGKLLENLRASGTAPESITDVLLTHAHPDHVCGLVDSEGKAVFRNATVWLPGAEADFWLSAETRAKAPTEQQKYFDMAVKAMKPYDEAGRLKRFVDGDALPPGTRVFKTPGHTPGHVSWLIDGADEQAEKAASRNSLLVWGDIVHFHSLQFEHPRIWAGFDAVPETAVKSRLGIMTRAEEQGWWIAGAHLPFPGIGHVADNGKAWRWVPTEFSPVEKP